MRVRLEIETKNATLGHTTVLFIAIERAYCF